MLNHVMMARYDSMANACVYDYTLAYRMLHHSLSLPLIIRLNWTGDDSNGRIGSIIIRLGRDAGFKVIPSGDVSMVPNEPMENFNI